MDGEQASGDPAAEEPSFVRARGIYDRFLDERVEDPSASLEELVRRHPDHASDLRALDERFQRAAAFLSRLGLPGSRSRDRDSAASGPPSAELLALVRAEWAAPEGSEIYRVEGRVGSGGMGDVWRALDRRLRRRVAMKTLREPARAPASGVRQSRRLARFLDEGYIAAQLQHPSILTVLDVGVDASGEPFFTMPLVEGEDFARVLERVRAGEDGWTMPRALGTLLRVCEAMAYAHSRGIVHRDLKPSNVMVGRFGETYVTDWGLAKRVADSHAAGSAAPCESAPETFRDAAASEPGSSDLRTNDGEVVGTPAYMAPEQAHGRLDEVGFAADVYALGAMLYELLSGRRPYLREEGADGPEELMERVRRGPPAPLSRAAPRAPAELVAICERAMARRPEERYAGMEELEGDLRAFLEGRVVRAHRTGPWIELVKWVQRNRWAATAIAALVVGAVGIALVQTGAAREQRRLNAGLRRSLYRNEISSAYDAFAESRVLEARSRLAECPEELRGWEWDHLERISDTSDRVVHAHPGRYGLGQVRYSADGRRIATAGSDRRVVVWDVATLQPLCELEVAREVVDDLEITPDGAAVLAVDRRHDLFVVDVASRAVREPEAARGSTIRVALAPDGARFAAVTSTGGLQLWGMAALELERSVEAHEGYGHSVLWSSDGTAIVTAGSDGTMKGWSAVDLSLLWAVPLGCDQLTGLLPDGTAVLARTEDHSAILLVSVPGGEVLARREGDYRWAEPSRGGTVLLSAPIPELWEPDGDRVLTWFAGHRASVGRPAFSPDGRWLATPGGDGTLRLWDLHRADRRRVLETGHVRWAAFGPSGERFALAIQSGTLEIWSVPDSKRIAATSIDRSLASIDWSQDGRWLAVGGWRGELTIVDARTLEVASEVDGHRGRVEWVEFSSDAERLVSACQDGAVRVFDRSSGALLWSADVHGFAYRARFSPDGSRVASTGDDRQVVLFDARSGAILETWSGEGVYGGSVAFSPDGRRLCSAGMSSSGWQRDVGIQLRDLESGELLWSHEDNNGIGSPTFLPDGTRIFAGRCIRDAKDGLRLATLCEAPMEVRAVSPDGATALFGIAGRLRILAARPW